MTVLPQVNINGDSAETLLTQVYAVRRQALLLGEALARAAPHGRNYQTLPDGALHGARKEWLELLAAKNLISEWAEAHLGTLVAQCHQRHGDPESLVIMRRVMGP